jgi:hypothetical protein
MSSTETANRLSELLPKACGWFHATDGPCQLCAGAVANCRGRGMSDEAILADIELYLSDWNAWYAREAL